MSPSTLAPPPSPFERALRPLVKIEPGEWPQLIASFVTFFCVLTAYYLIRPVRDEISASASGEVRQWLFPIVFLVMVAAVPAFGWVVTRFDRARVFPTIYLFFTGLLLLFWLAMSAGFTPAWLPLAFYVWASVFNLFVVSLFWSLMTDIYRSDQATRLYGFIAAGGTAGAFTGPLIANGLVRTLGATNLLLVSAVFLFAAIAGAAAARRYASPSLPQVRAQTAPATFRDMIAGAERVWQSPYFFRIALVIFIANVIGTFFYLEQTRIVGETIATKDGRVEFLARLDLIVSTITIFLQVLGTGRVMDRLGVGFAVATLPLVAIVGLLALSLSPGLAAVAAVLVAERVTAFSFASPAVKVLYTVAAPEDKYKAQNFIDTVVYRGGDAASGLIFESLRKNAGLGLPGIALLAIPLAVWWLSLSLALGREQAGKAAGKTHKMV